MKKRILVTIFFFTIASFMNLNAQWARTYGGSDYDSVRAPIQETSDGGYIVAGLTYSYGAGLADIWISKLSSNGTIEWQRAYGGSDYDRAYFVQETSDGGYIVAGETYSFGVGDYDIWILKLASEGNIEWQRTYGGIDEDYAWSIQQTNDGGYIVAGETFSFGAGWADIWVLKLSSVGGIEWQRTYGGIDGDYAWSIQQTSDGGYIVAGETFSFGGGEGDAWILKLSSAGDIEWQRTYGGYDQDWSSTIQQTSDGGYIIAAGGYSFGAGSNDGWILKLSSVGDIEWQRTYGGIDEDYAWSIQQTSDGGYIIAGYTYSFGGGEDDAWVLKLSSSGDIEWQHTYGGIDYDYVRSILQASDGGYIVGASTYSFGAGGVDFLVLKLYSDGDIDSSCGFIGSPNASILSTYVSPETTYISPGNSYITPLTTSVTPQNTSASVMLLCEAPEYTITISSTTGGTTNPVAGSYTYYDRKEVSITATRETNYSFSSWTGDVLSGHETDNPITISMDADKTITANFTYTPPEENGDGDEGGKKGGCFIATAAYGSPLHPHLDILRDFRDTYLMPNEVGRALVDLYYKYSPHVVGLIAKHKVLKVTVQINLLPFVALSYSMLHLGPIITAIMLALIFMVPIFLISFLRRKLKRG